MSCSLVAVCSKTAGQSIGYKNPVNPSVSSINVKTSTAERFENDVLSI